ncbi:MAG: hypothetical protein E7370_03345 [Clostridiales bacterium]|nr:hypothetical protein [Clostridiales bacterium]
MKLSSLFGKTVQSANSSVSGYLVSVSVLQNKIAYLTCVDGDEKKFFVDIDSVICLNERIIFSNLATVLKRCDTVRLGKPCYLYDGKFMGYLTDFEVKGATLKYAVVGNRKFCVDDLCFGDAVIINKEARLKCAVKKGDKILFKKGEKLSPQLMQSAKLNGEYIQTHLKSL